MKAKTIRLIALSIQIALMVLAISMGIRMYKTLDCELERINLIEQEIKKFDPANQMAPAGEQHEKKGLKNKRNA